MQGGDRLIVRVFGPELWFNLRNAKRQSHGEKKTPPSPRFRGLHEVLALLEERPRLGHRLREGTQEGERRGRASKGARDGRRGCDWHDRAVADASK